MAKKNKETWTTQDGITLYLTEMEDTHLFNALMFLARQRERALQMEMPRIASGFARKMEAFLEECYRRELFVDIDEIDAGQIDAAGIEEEEAVVGARLRGQQIGLAVAHRVAGGACRTAHLAARGRSRGRNGIFRRGERGFHAVSRFSGAIRERRIVLIVVFRTGPTRPTGQVAAIGRFGPMRPDDTATLR